MSFFFITFDQVFDLLHSNKFGSPLKYLIVFKPPLSVSPFFNFFKELIFYASDPEKHQTYRRFAAFLLTVGSYVQSGFYLEDLYHTPNFNLDSYC